MWKPFLFAGTITVQITREAGGCEKVVVKTSREDHFSSTAMRLEVNGTIFAVISPHTLLPSYPNRGKSENEGELEDNDCSFGGFELEDDDGDVDDRGATSRGSATPHESEASEFESHESESPESVIHSTESTEWNDSGQPATFLEYDTYPSKTRSPSGISLEHDVFAFKQFELISWDLDYSLINLRQVQQESTKITQQQKGKKSDTITIDWQVYSGPATLQDHESDLVNIQTLHGLVTGKLEGKMTSVRLPYGTLFVDVYTLFLDTPLVPGDCGAIVRAAGSGVPYGHIITGNRGLGTAFAMPLHTIVADIRKRIMPVPTYTAQGPMISHHDCLVPGCNPTAFATRRALEQHYQEKHTLPYPKTESTQSMDSIDRQNDHTQGRADKRRGNGSPPNRGWKKRKSDSSSSNTTRRELKHGFACPFVKFDPDKYNCQPLLKRIGDVRQHILRKHKQKLHCPICQDIFDSDEAKITHMNQRSCQPPAVAVNLPGASTDQWNEICNRPRDQRWRNTVGGEEERWFVIWDILFPNISRPESAYVLTTGSEFVRSARGLVARFWRQQKGWEFVQDLLPAYEDFPAEYRDEAYAQLHENFTHFTDLLLNFMEDQDEESSDTSQIPTETPRGGNQDVGSHNHGI
jgi:hypothetical protein